MSDWEAEYDEIGKAISKTSHVNTATYTRWKAASNRDVTVTTERDSNNRRQTRPMTLTLENSLIGRVIGKLALYTFTGVHNNNNNRLVR